MHDNDAQESAETRSAAPWKMIVFGILTFWAPYVFIWFVLKPSYPRWYRILLISWAVFWTACALLYIGAAMFGPPGRAM